MNRLSTYTLIAFFLAAGLFVQQAVAGEPKIHVVIAADARAGFGDNLTADYKSMERVFRENVPKSRLNLVLVQPQSVTPDSILAAIEQIKPDKDDTLVFYYSGHAANDDRSGGHYFQLKDKDGKPAELRRRTVLAGMKAAPVRLCVLLTDCCNLRDSASRNIKDAVPTAAPPPRRISPLFETLFIASRGVVDVTSSKPGEASFLDTTAKKRGSCFTYPLVALLEKHRDDSGMTWPRFAAELKTDVQKAFTESWPDGYKFDGSRNHFVQKTQTVHVYGPLPGEDFSSDLPESGPRFGVRAVNHHGRGVRITQVVPKSPGHRAGFEAGDIITEINGKTVADEKSYSDLIDASPKACEIKLINVNDGKTISVRFDLRN